jgi:hypothetical protein
LLLVLQVPVAWLSQPIKRIPDPTDKARVKRGGFIAAVIASVLLVGTAESLSARKKS